MTGSGSKRYSLRSRGSNQAFSRTVDTTEKISGAQSPKPSFEAFQIGAWWDSEILEKRGQNYLVHFEGYGRHEEQVLPPDSVRLRSRKAENSDCHCLILGVDVVAFVVHPHASRSGSNMSLNCAWYDVKIISKEYKHHLCACACKFKVKFYGESSKNIEVEKRRVLLEGTEMEVMIGKIGIMQVTFDSPLESIIEETFTLSKRRMKKRWSKDTYTLNLNCVFQKPAFSVRKKEDAETTSIKARDEIPTSCSDNGCSEENCTEDLFVHEEGRKRARISLPRKAKVVNGGVYAENGRSMKHARTENDKDTLPDESNSSYQYSGTNESSSTGESYNSEHTYDPEDHATDHSLSRSTPVFYGSIGKDQSKSTSTRTFYGNKDEFNENSHSTEVFYGPQGEEEVDISLSTCSSKSNCEERSGCYCENMQTSSDCSHSVPCKACKLLEVESSSPMTMPTSFQEESLNKAQAQNDSVEMAQNDSIKMPANCCGMKTDISCSDSECPLIFKVSKREGDTKRVQAQDDSIKMAQNDSIKMPTYCGMETDTIYSDSERPFKVSRREGDTKRGQAQNNSIKTVRNDSIKMPADCGMKTYTIYSDSEHPFKVSRREGDTKRGQAHNDSIKMPYCAMKTNTICSDSECSSQFSKRDGDTKSVQYKLKPKFGQTKPRAIERKEEKTKKILFQSNPAVPRNRGRPRSSRVQEGKMDFNDLFERILSSVHELQWVKGMISSEDIVASFEEKRNQVPWDPLIFHEKEDLGPNLETTPADNPFKCIWRDMESAFEEMEMHEMGWAAPTQQHDQPWQDKASDCEHCLVLNEEEGHVCSHCGFLVTNIENVCPPIQEDKVHRGGDRDNKAENEADAFEAAFDVSKEQEIISKRPLKINVASVWELIPELKGGMQKNQVDGFNFLWENIGALSSQNDTEGGGCIIAHAPGTGKSLLIISFLKSFLILNAWCRPLIVAPKNMLLSWQREFTKWKADIKVYLLRSAPPSPLNYLKIISEWQKSTSVLVVTYNLFATLTDEDRACRTPQDRRLGSLLLHIPDILILDEGHVPRNCSKLRDSVMQVRTRFKILVSGTLFQNNLQELFNLLYLARPNFLDYLGPHSRYKRMQGFDVEDANKQWQSFEEFERERWKRTTRDEAELSCRKIFMDEIGNKLEMNVEENEGAEFKGAMAKLHKITSPFIHFYNGEILSKLPGIKESIVVLQATDLQVSLSTQIKKQDHFETSLNIHPSILLKWKKTKSWTSLDVDKLKALRVDPLQGPKVKFILDLADCCHSLQEKLLIFSQYLPTLDYVAEMLRKKFKIVMIKGKDRLEERQRTIDKFNDCEGTLILLASLTACGEGINLTGASRVVFMDMHWNPARMKQAIGRAFRIGQKKIVYTYWLMASVEKEAHKFTRIQQKDFLSKSIFSSGVKKVLVCQPGESVSEVKGEEDIMLQQLVRNDISRSILTVVNYSALERGTLSAFFEEHNISGR